MRLATHILASDCVDHIIRWRSQKLSDDRKLVDMVLSREQRLALEHFGEDTSCAPNIDLYVVLLPREHNLWRSVVPGGNIAGHLGILDTGQAKIANLEIAVLINQDVARFQVSVNDAR